MVEQPPAPVLALDLIEKRQKIVMGVTFKNGRLVIFAGAERKRGRKWDPEGQVEFSPDLPAFTVPVLQRVVEVWLDKYNAVDDTLRSTKRRPTKKMKKLKKGRV